MQGVILWGYVQGQMWRTDAHLIRTDGTERPALKWLRGYVKLTNGYYKLRNVGTGKYLDSSSNGVLSVKRSVGGDGGYWRFAQSSGYYNIDNKYSGRGILDTGDANAVKWIATEPVLAEDDKLWEAVWVRDNVYRFENKHTSRGYLCAASDSMVKWNTGGTGSETEWELIP